MPNLPAPDASLIVEWQGEMDPAISTIKHSTGINRVSLTADFTLAAGWIEVVPLPDGGRLLHSGYRFSSDAPRIAHLATAKERFTGPSLVLLTLSSGHAIIKDVIHDVTLEFAPGRAVVQSCDHLEQIHNVDTSRPLAHAGLVLSHGYLRTLLGEEGARELLRALGIETLGPIRPVNLAPDICSRLWPPCGSLPDSIRALQAQARVLDFLVALSSDQLGKTQAKNVWEEPLRAVKLELDAWCTGPVPDLEDMARRHGVSGRALNNHFREAYGQTIFAYIQEHRLQTAYAALKESRLPQKSIASTLGYASLSQFQRAFVRRFGHPPGALRGDDKSRPIGATESRPNGASKRR